MRVFLCENQKNLNLLRKVASTRPRKSGPLGASVSTWSLRDVQYPANEPLANHYTFTFPPTDEAFAVSREFLRRYRERAQSTFGGGAGKKKKKPPPDQENPDVGIPILPGDVLERNVDKWIAEMRSLYGQYSRDSGKLRKASTRDKMKRTKHMLESLNEALGLTGLMGPLADDGEARQGRFLDLCNAVRGPMERALRSVHRMLPEPPLPAPRLGLLQVTGQELDEMHMKVDTTITKTFGPHFPLEALNVTGDGSCGVRSVLYAAGINTNHYNVAALRLAGAVQLLRMQDSAVDIAYSASSITWLVAKDGWLDRTAIDACCHALNNSLLVLQPLAVNGKLRDQQHLEMGLSSTSTHHQLAAVTKAYVWDKKPFQDLVNVRLNLDVGRTVTETSAHNSPLADYNHFVPIVCVRRERPLDVYNEKASVFNKRVTEWTDFFLHKFGYIFFVLEEGEMKRKGNSDWYGFLNKHNKTLDYIGRRLQWWDDRSRPINPSPAEWTSMETLLQAVRAISVEPPESEKYFEILRLMVCHAQIADRAVGGRDTLDKISELAANAADIVDAMNVELDVNTASVAPLFPIDR